MFVSNKRRLPFRTRLVTIKFLEDDQYWIICGINIIIDLISPFIRERKGLVTSLYPRSHDLPREGGIEVISINLAFMLSAQVLRFVAHLER